MELGFLDVVGVPLLMLLIILPYVLFLKRVKLTTRPRTPLDFLYIYRSNLRLEYEGWFLTLAIPILSVLFLDLVVFKLMFGLSLADYGENLIYGILVRGILNPFSEEIIFRGFFLGMFAATMIEVYRYQFSKKASDIIYVPFLLFVSFLFVLPHNNYQLAPDLVRLLSGLLYGSLYLFSKRNLLPAIVAHAFSNILIVLLNWQG